MTSNNCQIDSSDMKNLVIFITLTTILTVTNCQRKIFGGETGIKGKFGHVVYLKMDRAACTGCIIHENWVLTAAHCVCTSPDNVIWPSIVTIVAGSIDVDKTDSNTQVRKGKEIIVHEDYMPKLGKPDLAVIRVNSSFEFNESVQKMGFSTSAWPQNRKNIWEDCVSAGWGLTEDGLSSELKYMNTTARHGKNTCPCIQKYYVLKRYVCLPSRPPGICFGDSGGALVCSGKIVGVAHIILDKRICSYTEKGDSKINCGSQHVFGIYIYTCPFLDWISEFVPGVPGTPESCTGKRSSLPIASQIVYTAIYVIFITLLCSS